MWLFISAVQELADTQVGVLVVLYLISVSLVYYILSDLRTVRLKDILETSL